MKKVFLLMLFTLNLSLAQQQVHYAGFESAVGVDAAAIQGNWTISQLIVGKDADEYTLTSQTKERTFQYGNHISLQPDGTFVCGYSAPCGNDCFTTSVGKYKLINTDYICLFLEKSTQNGDCHSNSDPNEDLGLFRIYRNERGIVLCKSDGNPQQDADNRKYVNLLTAINTEIGQNYYFLEWKELKPPVTTAEAIASGLAENHIANYQVLYTKFNVALIEAGGDYFYIKYEPKGKGLRVALYDNTAFTKADQEAVSIDRDKSLKKEEFQDAYDYSRNPYRKGTMVLFKKDGKIVKMGVTIYNTLGKFVETFYFKEKLPFVIKVDCPNGHKFTYYVGSWNNSRAAMRPLEENWSFTGVQQVYYEMLRANDYLAELR
jgi:hypothetical protein